MQRINGALSVAIKELLDNICLATKLGSSYEVGQGFGTKCDRRCHCPTGNLPVRARQHAATAHDLRDTRHQRMSRYMMSKQSLRSINLQHVDQPLAGNFMQQRNQERVGIQLLSSIQQQHLDITTKPQISLEKIVVQHGQFSC